MITKFFIKLGQRQHGSAMIELSLILPILILMLLGALDIGLLLRQSMIVASSARMGAEYGTLWSTASDTSTMQFYALYEATINNNIPNFSAVAANVCTCGTGGAAVACGGSCAGGTQPAQYAQVTATATLPLIFGVTGFPATIPVKSIATVRVPWREGH